MTRRYYWELTEAELAKYYPNEIQRKCMQRVPRYLRLGFTSNKIEQFILDDQLWEEVKDLPIDPNNSVDALNKALKEGLKEGVGDKELRKLIRKEMNKKPYS